MVKKIEQVDLGNGETISMMKGQFGYRIVQPHKDENGKIIWINVLIGGWANFFKLLFILVVILSFLYGVKEMLGSCNEMAENPCAYTNLDCSQSSYRGENVVTDYPQIKVGDYYGEG